jgi:RNA polymerase sigma-70 factor (ECF subfamily)
MSAPFLPTSGTTLRLVLRLQNFRGGSERSCERNNATALDVSESYEQRVNLRVSASEDQADAERVLAGDESAFEGIVRRWQAPLVNLAYRFCRDPGRAEEMAQEAFLRAYRGLRQWRRDAAFSTWLFAVATNLYRSELRRIPDRTVSIGDVTELRDPRPSDGGLAEEDRYQAVRSAILTLPAKYRDPMILFYFHEMDIAAAARSLNLPQGTVKARLSRGRELLRERFERRFGTPRWREV